MVMKKQKKPPQGGDEDVGPIERDPRTKCLGSVRAPEGIAEWRTPKLPDGRELCKFFMKDPSSCAASEACLRAHVERADRAVCWSWEKYGVCDKGDHCWFPHPPAQPVSADIALQCYVGYAGRIVERCREILGGADVVVATARADLSSNSNAVVLISGGANRGSHRGGWSDERPARAWGAAGTVRTLAAADAHLMSSVKRVYLLNSTAQPSSSVAEAGTDTGTGSTSPRSVRSGDVSATGDCLPPVCSRGGAGGRGDMTWGRGDDAPTFIWRCAATGATSTSVAGDTPELQAAELTRRLRDMLSRARDAVGVKSAGAEPLQLRVRGFPRAVQNLTLDALDALDTMTTPPAKRKKEEEEEEEETTGGVGDGDGAEGGPSQPSPSFELSPTIDATHSLDVVGVKGRLYACLWPTASTGADASTGMEAMDASVTLHDVIHCGERLEEERARKDVMCRAFFKLEEAISRGGVPFGKDWQCIDIGASPGGWTQFLSSRLLELGGAPGGGDGAGLTAASGDRSAGSRSRGHVWAVDPGLLRFESTSFPVNVTHIPMRAEESHGAISRDTSARGLSERDVRMLVCDANMSPAAVVAVLLSMTPLLAPGAFLITTFKNFCKGRRDWERQIREAVVRLEEAKFTGVRVFHLFSNCAQEKTLVAKFNP